MAKQNSAVASGVAVNGTQAVGVRRLACMVACNPGKCRETAEAKATAWNGRVHSDMGCGPHSAIVKLADGQDQIVGGESRMYIVTMSSSDFVAVYTPEFLATPLGKLFAKLSACRKRDEFVEAMREFANDDEAFDPERLFSASKNRNWQASRSNGTKAAWRIGTTGGVILLPLVAECAACYKLGKRGGSSKVATTSAESLAATMADCI